MDLLFKYGARRKSDMRCANNRKIIENFLRTAPLKALLHAPFGVGKTVIAYMIVKGLFCTAEPLMRPCGDCPNCLFVGERLKEKDSVRVQVPGAGSFEVVDCTKLSVQYAMWLREEIMVYANKPIIYVLDEFDQAKPEIQNIFLKLLEIEMTCSMILCFAEINTDRVVQPLLQRVTLLTPQKATVAELLPLVKLVTDGEGIPVVDASAPEMLVNVCARIPRVLLMALQMLAFDGEGLSLKSVQQVALKLQIINAGKEKSK